LRQIYRQFEDSGEADKKELRAFIDQITETKDGHIGACNMVDLIKFAPFLLAPRYLYSPSKTF